MNMTLRYMASALLVLLLCNPAAAQVAPAPATMKLDISAQRLDRALNVWARQTGLSIMIPTERTAGDRISPKVSGTYTPEEALRLLLADTDLRYEFVDERTVAIRAPKAGVKKSDGSTRAAGVRLARSEAQSMQKLDPVLSKGESQGEGDGQKNSKADAASAEAEPQEIIVTGSHIRGSSTAAAPVQVTTREEIERQGYATVAQMFENLPQNFTGGISEDQGFAVFSDENFTAASTVNLRGLGADSTLILLNGRRMAPAGQGSFVDISAIPLAALDRVEILTDGASAIYGADAMAGVVNYILLNDYSGARTQLRGGTLTDGGGDEYVLSQTYGHSWGSGSALLSYEFYRREVLYVHDRSFIFDADKRRYGGSDYRVSSCFPGTIQLGDGTTFAIPAGQDGTSLSQSRLAAGTRNLCGSMDGGTLLPRQKRHSLFAQARQQIGERVTLYADGLYSDRHARDISGSEALDLTVPAGNAFRQANNLFPGEGDITVQYSRMPELGNSRRESSAEAVNGSVGAELQLSSGWNADFSLAYGQNRDTSRFDGYINTAALDAALASSDMATAFNPFSGVASNSPAVIGGILTTVDDEGTTGEVLSANFLAQGPVFTLSGNRVVRLAAGAAYRDETFDSGSSFFPVSDRQVSSVFAEMNVPLLKPDASGGSARLDANLAGRWEDYSDFGETAVGKVSMAWAPVSAVTLRATYGNSFKAPLLRELYARSSATSLALPGFFDPQATEPLIGVILRSGGNTSLEPEKARTLTAGASVNLPFLERGTLQLTYFKTHIAERISTVNNLFTLFGGGEAFERAGILLRNPSQAQIDALVANTDSIFDAGVPYEEGEVDAILDTGARNLAESDLRGIDADFRFGLPVSRGSLDVSIGASYLLDYLEESVAGTVPRQLVNSFGRPIDLRVRGGVSWTLDAWELSAFLNYADGYKFDLRPGTVNPIASWTTVDISAAYNIAGGPAFFSGMKVSFSARNLFDTDPPFTDTNNGFDAANADASGRSVALMLTKTW